MGSLDQEIRSLVREHLENTPDDHDQTQHDPLVRGSVSGRRSLSARRRELRSSQVTDTNESQTVQGVLSAVREVQRSANDAASTSQSLRLFLGIMSESGELDVPEGVKETSIELEELLHSLQPQGSQTAGLDLSGLIGNGSNARPKRGISEIASMLQNVTNTFSQSRVLINEIQSLVSQNDSEAANGVLRLTNEIIDSLDEVDF